MANDRMASAGSCVSSPTGAPNRSPHNTLGTVRLRDQDTNRLVYVPTPSDDPKDPLNWSQGRKYYVLAIVCLAIMMSNVAAAGPTVAIVETTLSFYPTALEEGTLSQAAARIAFFFTTTALLQGTGNFLWVPLANKFGRRPIYIVSYSLYFVCILWLVFETNYAGFLAARILIGLGGGAAETIAPISIAEMFFLHERGKIMAAYTSFLSIGVSLGMIVDGLILINNDWRTIYQVATALVSFVLLLIVFTFPETAWPSRAIRDAGVIALDKMDSEPTVAERVPSKQPAAPWTFAAYLRSIKFYERVWTEESLMRMFLRPMALICLPAILWAALVQAVTIGFLVAVTSNVAVAFSEAYSMYTWQIGLCFIASVIGSLLGIPAGGLVGDKVADWLTSRNGGIRTPEMRLPAMIPCLVSAPLGLLLYGVGVDKDLHWICPTIGLGLLSFSIAQGTNICLVYVIDSYRPIAGEVTLAVMGFKSLFGFLLSFYTNPWIDGTGYLDAFGAMAGISAGIIIMWVPLFLWGGKLRQATWDWPFVSYIRWAEDREVGE